MKVWQQLMHNRTLEWAAWPVWVVTGFLIAMLAGGLVAGIAGLVGFGDSLDTTLGGMITGAVVYGFLLIALVSIGRIRHVIRMPKGVSASLIASGGVAIMSGLYMSELMNFRVYAIMLVLFGVFFVLASVPVKRRLVTKKLLGIERALSWSDIGLGVAGYVVYFVLFVVVSLVLTRLMPAYDSTQVQDIGFTALYGIDRIVGFIVLVVITPIVEELIMRGFLFGKLRESALPFWPAAIVVSIMFGVAHGQWNVGIDTFILSMVACYLREVTGTIWPGVIIHMAKNAVAYVMLFVFTLR